MNHEFCLVSGETGRTSNSLRKLPLNRIFHIKGLITFLDLSFSWRVCHLLNYVPPKGHVEVLISGIPVNMTLFGNRVFADNQVIKLRWGLYWLRMGLNPITSMFTMRERFEEYGDKRVQVIEAEVEWCGCKPRNSEHHKKVEGFFSRTLRGSMALPTSVFGLLDFKLLW